MSLAKLRLDRVDLALAALMLALTIPVVQPLGAQQASRLALTAAIWDDQSIWLDDYPLGVDQAEHEGHVVSDKSPGQPIFAIPAYALYRMVGGEPARELRVEGNLGLWWVSVWSAALPGAGLVLLVRRALRSAGRPYAAHAALSVGIGTLILPFSTLLFGHVLSTLFAFGAWHALTRQELERRHLLLSGTLAGCAVITEYTMMIAAVVLLVLAVHRVRARAAWMVLGSLPLALVLAAYQWAAFGSPLTPSYGRSTFSEQTTAVASDRANLSTFEVTWRVLFSDRGLFFATPVVALGLAGLVAACRRETGSRRAALASGLLVALGVITVQCLWGNAFGGDSPGPRYATAAAVFVAPGVAVAWSRWRAASIVTTAVGAVIMISAAWTDPIIHPDSRGVTGHWVSSLLRGEWVLTIYEVATGHRVTMVLLPIIAAGIGGLVLRALRSEPGLLIPGPGARVSDP